MNRRVSEEKYLQFATNLFAFRHGLDQSHDFVAITMSKVNFYINYFTHMSVLSNRQLDTLMLKSARNFTIKMNSILI